MQETVEEIKEKVTEMAVLMESLQMSISVLQKSNRHLHETVKEVYYTVVSSPVISIVCRVALSPTRQFTGCFLLGSSRTVLGFIYR